MATVKKIKKAQRGGCLSTTGASTRIKMYKQAAGEGSSDRMYRKEARQAARAERQEARAEKKAAKAAPAKYGKAVKKAQSGTALTEMGKKTTKAAVKKRTDDMAKSLDKASVLGKNYIAPGDSAKKKPVVKKLAPKKKMMNGGKAKMGKCKYGC
jgi:hypothetical protein